MQWQQVELNSSALNIDIMDYHDWQKKDLIKKVQKLNLENKLLKLNMNQYSLEDLELFEIALQNSSEEYTYRIKAKIINRLRELNPLWKEISDKGFSMQEISNDLNNEYCKLIMLRNNYIV